MASYSWGQPLKSVPTILDNWYFSLFKYILKKFKTNIFLQICFYWCVWVYVFYLWSMSVCWPQLCQCWGKQKKVTDPLGLELQMIMGHPSWALGTKFKSFMQGQQGLRDFSHPKSIFMLRYFSVTSIGRKSKSVKINIKFCASFIGSIRNYSFCVAYSMLALLSNPAANCCKLCVHGLRKTHF